MTLTDDDRADGNDVTLLSLRVRFCDRLSEWPEKPCCSLDSSRSEFKMVQCPDVRVLNVSQRVSDASNPLPAVSTLLFLTDPERFDPTQADLNSGSTTNRSEWLGLCSWCIHATTCNAEEVTWYRHISNDFSRTWTAASEHFWRQTKN